MVVILDLSAQTSHCAVLPSVPQNGFDCAVDWLKVILARYCFPGGECIANGPRQPRACTQEDGTRCTRLFQDLWRLKTHYQASPHIRGSGQERGHASVITFCPRCLTTVGLRCCYSEANLLALSRLLQVWKHRKHVCPMNGVSLTEEEMAQGPTARFAEAQVTATSLIVLYHVRAVLICSVSCQRDESELRGAWWTWTTLISPSVGEWSAGRR